MIEQKQEMVKDAALITAGGGIFSMSFWLDVAQIAEIITMLSGAVIGVATAVYAVKRAIKNPK